MDPNRKKLIIIGHGMVGHHFCHLAIEANLHFKFDITVFGEEPSFAYDRVKLSDLFYGKTPQSLLLTNQDWYDNNGINIKINETIEKLDTLENILTSNKNNTYQYDKLVFATGSSAFYPPIDGLRQHEHIYPYRNLRDVEHIKEVAKTKKRVAIIGGGLLGLEAARACKELDLTTFIIEHAEYLMPKQLNKEASSMLSKTLEDLDIELLLNKQCKKVSFREGELIIDLSQDDRLAIDMIIVAAGILPRDDVAKNAGIQCNPRGGIIVDSKLNTSHPNIYAIGECAVFDGKVFGLVSHGYRMSSVLIEQFLNKESTFEGHEHSTRLKLMGVEVTSLGQPFQQATIITYRNDHQSIYRRLSLHNNKLIGFISLGHWDHLSELQKRLEFGEKISFQEIETFKEHGEFSITESTDQQINPSSWPDSMIICHCMNISKGSIEKAYHEGAQTIEAIGQKTCAGTVCGSCQNNIAIITQTSLDYSNIKSEHKKLGFALLASAITLLLFLVTPGWSYSQSILDPKYNIEFLWKESFYKQLTGFTCLAIFFVSLGLALRKRVKSFNQQQIRFWQTVHIIAVTLIYLILFLHTGWRMGSNLNFYLMTSFTIATLSGLCLGTAYYLEEIGKVWLIKWRKTMYWFHLVSFWPIPVLTFFHLLKTYRY